MIYLMKDMNFIRTKLLTTILFLGVLGVIPFAHAKDFSVLKVSFSDDINKDCGQPAGYDPVRACFLSWSTQIIIRKGLPKKVVEYVFLHEVGHYLVSDYSDEQLKALNVFNPLPDKLKNTSIRNVAAEQFVTWFWGGDVGKVQGDFFTKLLVSK